MAIEIDQLYRDSRDALKKKAAERFKSVLSDEEYSSIRKKIVNELLDGFDANGTKSEFLKNCFPVRWSLIEIPCFHAAMAGLTSSPARGT